MSSFLVPLAEMSLLFVGWGLVALVQVGWGVLVTSLLRGQRFSWVTAFWVGFGAILVALQLWHLFLPITFLTTALVVVVGGVGLLLGGRALWRQDGVFLQWGWLAIALLLLLLTLNEALQSPIFYDNGLYHLQSIQWVKQYAILPGLANLYGPYAFNSSYFLQVALWDRVFGAFMGAQVLNGLLTVALAVQGIDALARVVATRKFTPASLFAILLLYPLINLTFEPLANYLSGPTPDYPIWLLSLKLGLDAMELVESPDEDPSRSWSILFLALVLVTIKLSGAVFAAVLIGVVGLLVWRTPAMTWQRLLRGLVLMGMVVIVPWMVRSVVLSGYVIYPTSAGGLPVEWRVSDEQAVEDTNDVRSWSRYPQVGSRWQEVLLNWEWFPSWYDSFWQTRGIKASILLGSVAWGIVGLGVFMRRELSPPLQRLLWWLLPPVLCLVFWFFSAPSVRYAPPYFWLIAMGGVVALVESFPLLSRLIHRLLLYRLTPLILGSALVGLLLVSFGGRWQYERGEVPSVVTAPFETISGFILQVPTADELCWEAPLPCTAYPNGNLRLREAGNLGAGFTVQPLNQ